MTSRILDGGFGAAWLKWRQSRRTINELSKLSAHELRDIELSRDDARPFHPWKYPQH